MAEDRKGTEAKEGITGADQPSAPSRGPAGARGISEAPDSEAALPGGTHPEDPITAPGDDAPAPGGVRAPEGAGATLSGANDPATEEGDRVTAPKHTTERLGASATLMASASGGRPGGETPHGAREPDDALDNAAEEEALPGERPHVDTPDGSAVPAPGVGGVVAPGGTDRADEERRDDEGAGAGNRGAGGTTVPADALDPKESPTERRLGDGAAMTVGTLRASGEARQADALFAADGPTAAEAGPEGRYVPAGETAEGLHALGVEAGRKGWVLWVMGIAAVIAGFLALAMPLVSSLAASVFVAAMLLASGTVGLVTSFRNREGTDLAMGFALSALSVVAGAVMLLAPFAGIVALGTLIIAFFAASGAMKIWYGLKHEDAKGRGWLIAAGAVSVALAVMLWFSLPGSALWLPGVLLAIELVMTGTLLIALAIWGKPKVDLPDEARA